MPQNLLFVEVTKFLIGVSFSVPVTPLSDHEGPILSYKGTLSGHKSPCQVIRAPIRAKRAHLFGVKSLCQVTCGSFVRPYKWDPLIGHNNPLMINRAL